MDKTKEAEQKKIRQNLPYNWGKIVAEKLNVSRMTVWRAFQSFDPSSYVLQEIINLAEETRNKKEEVIKKINKLGD
jgi:hypothetical protein